MMDLRPLNHTTTAGLILVAATAGTGLLGVEHLLSGASAAIVLVALAALKGVIIILDFMELRSAPLIWGRMAFVWVALVSAIILSGLLIAPSGVS